MVGNSNQLERLRKDSRELGHYIHKLNKKGKADIAYKVAKRQTFLETAIQHAESRLRGWSVSNTGLFIGGPFYVLDNDIMPTYDMKHIKTGEVTEMIISISKMTEMVESGEWTNQINSAPQMVTGVGSVLSKTSSDWKDKLKQIKSNQSRYVKNTIHD